MKKLLCIFFLSLLSSCQNDDDIIAEPTRVTSFEVTKTSSREIEITFSIKAGEKETTRLVIQSENNTEITTYEYVGSIENGIETISGLEPETEIAITFLETKTGEVLFSKKVMTNLPVELIISSSENCPISYTRYEVDENDISDSIESYVFSLEVPAESADVLLGKISFEVDTHGKSFNLIISDMSISIDGKDFNAWDHRSIQGTTKELVIFNTQNMLLSNGEIYDVQVFVTYMKQNNNYQEGQGISFEVSEKSLQETVAFDEEANTLSSLDITGSADMRNYFLFSKGIDVALIKSEAITFNNKGVFEYQVEIEAFEAPAYISKVGKSSIIFSIINTGTQQKISVSDSDISVYMGSNAFVYANDYIIDQNGTENFQIGIVAQLPKGKYKCVIEKIKYKNGSESYERLLDPDIYISKEIEIF